MSAVSDTGTDSGVNANPFATAGTASPTGAVWVFTLQNQEFRRQTFIKLSDAFDSAIASSFGRQVSLNDSGNVLVVTANDRGTAVGINGDPNQSPSSFSNGAAHVFERRGTTWHELAYLKAPHGSFLTSAKIDGTGNTVTLGAWGDRSVANGINEEQTDFSFGDAGSVFLY